VPTPDPTPRPDRPTPAAFESACSDDLRLCAPRCTRKLPENRFCTPQPNLAPTVSASAGKFVAHTWGVAPCVHPVWQTARCQQTVLWIWLLGLTLALLRLVAGLIGTWRVTSRETISNPCSLKRWPRFRSNWAENASLRSADRRRSRLPAGSADLGPLPPDAVAATRVLKVVARETAYGRAARTGDIQRADWLVQVLAEVTRALYWFHPLVWWTIYRLHAESERACDDTVLLTGVAPSAYAETLLEVIRTMNDPNPLLRPRHPC